MYVENWHCGELRLSTALVVKRFRRHTFCEERSLESILRLPSCFVMSLPVEPEKVQNVAVHEVYVDLRSLLTVRSPCCRRIRYVVRNVVHKTPIDTDRSSRAGHITNFLWRITDEASTIVPVHDCHALKVPVRLRIICEDSEIMVLCIGIGVVVEVESDIWADASGNTVTKCADLCMRQLSK
jgi:hypothetical protein